MKPHLYFFAFVFLFASCNKNDNPEPDKSGYFIKLFGNASDDAGFSVVETSDGGYVLSGTTISEGYEDQDIFVVKIDQNGNKVWENAIRGEYSDEGNAIVENEAGNFVVVGSVQSDGGTYDAVVHELASADGKLIKSATIGEPDRNEKGFFLTSTKSGGYVVLGSTAPVAGSTKDMLLAKTDLETSEWERKIGLLNVEDSVGAIRELPNGNLIWVGTVYRSGKPDLRIIESDSYGNLIWDYGYTENDGISQTGHDIQVLDNGQGYVAVGSAGEGESKDVLLVKTDVNGDLINGIGVKRSEQPGEQEAFSVAVTKSHNVVTGYTIKNKNKDIYLGFFDKNGNLVNEKSFGGAGDDVGKLILNTVDGGFLVVSTVTVANNTMIGVYKLDSNGELIN